MGETGDRAEFARIRAELECTRDRARVAERELQEFEARYAMIVRATNEVVWDWDLRTDRVDWNEAVKDVFRYGPGEISPTVEWWIDHIHPDDRARFTGEAESLIDGGGSFWSREFRFLCGDGSYAAVFDRGYVAHDAAGRPVRMIGSMVDLTARRAAEEELRRLKDEAQQASRAKSNFLAAMSHELRTPLNAILGYASILEEEIAGTLNPSQKTQLGCIRASGGHLLGLIEQLLAYSQIEAGAAQVRPEHFDATAVAHEVAALIEPLAVRKGLTLSEEFPERSVEMEMTSDPGKIRQILLHLLSNAVKFTAEGTVWLRLRRVDDVIQFEVTDTGPGIAPDDRERIFQLFEQGETGPTRTVGGMGIGLSVSRELACLLGGTISVESEPGRGSTFSLRLPLERGAHIR